MCSNQAARLALIGEAIDQLAAEAADAADADPGLVASRIAAIWAMMAELDPGLARRLRGYTGEPPGDPAEEPGGHAPGMPGPGSS